MKLLPLAAAVLSISILAPVAAHADVDFRSQIKPILTKNCVACHGGVKRASGVSFASGVSARGPGKSGRATIVPGDPRASELYRRITSADPDDRMPPADERPEGISAREIEVIERWISEGAEWAEHWAFEPPHPPSPPEVSDPSWPRTPLDHFVLARLDQERLEPARDAERAQWLRRASFDLVGLPPSPEALAAFLEDKSSSAFETAADRLLSSPSFGERWAAMWIDLARYADSQGYEKDLPRTAWAYRDWVIRAFNDDMPFDRFTVAQIAGDLLPDATLDDYIATAFHRNTQTNTEGGTDDEEFRVSAIVDRVNTTWTVFQATTFGCVQCHSHPYDPFTNEEYYRFLAIFNNTEDADLNNEYPTLRVPLDHSRFDETLRFDREIDAIRERLNDAGREAERQDDGWTPLSIKSIDGPKTGVFTVDGNEVLVGGTVPQGSTYHVASVPRDLVTAIRVNILPEKLPPEKVPEHGSVLSRFRAEIELDGGERTEVKLSEVFAETLSGPFDPNDSLAKNMFGGGKYPKLDQPTWLVFALGSPIELPGGSVLHLFLSCNIRSAETKGALLRRFRISTSTSDAWTGLVKSPARAADRSRLAALRKERDAIPSTVVPVMRERPEEARRATWTFVRGNFMDRDREVEPGVPAIMNPLPEGARPDRLGLARWLVSPENPLTGRVIVNRIWNELFGVGIVETLEDFGSRGQPPSHPALLDFLALRFQNEHDWRIKSLLRELVLSRTYRQDNHVSPEAARRDPRNRLLARGPRTRLTAEMVRDQALAVSGLLSKKMLGPSVMPPQPDGVWEIVYSGASWKVPEGEDRYRRALYTYMRRTSPYPSFLTFDGPSREVCVPRRITTNTPLQALVTLNDPVYVECARALATRMRARGESLQEQIAAGYLLATQRAPSSTALSHLERLFEDASAALSETPEDARALAATPADAALVLVANTLLNLDAALTK